MNEKMTALWKYNFWSDNAFDLGFMRTGYTERIEKLTGNRLVKVLVGQRRAGKSFVLRQLAQAHRKRRAPQEYLHVEQGV